MEESLQLLYDYGLYWGVGGTLSFLGRVAHRQGDDARARQLGQEGLAALQATQQWWQMAEGLETLAGAAAKGEPQRAAVLFGAAEAVRQSGNSQKHELYHRSDYERDVGIARAQLDDATWQAAWAEGRAMTLEQAIAYALEETPDA